ncbi:MAG: permease [Candidatus Hydrogenedentes bacterium]|nr:permease [Candidatus Hydrogenedentota bacterium]
MFVGHFALGPAAKSIAPNVPIWALILAPQFMDIFFGIFMLLGLEGLQPDGNFEVYGQFRGDILYTHSLVGALLISALAFAIGKRFWKTPAAAWTLALLTFSHWPTDLLVHHHDMPWLPGNLGGFPLLGFALWEYPLVVLAIETLMASMGAALYLRWARNQPPESRRYAGPIFVCIFFVVLLATNVAQLPK